MQTTVLAYPVLKPGQAAEAAAVLTYRRHLLQAVVVSQLSTDKNLYNISYK